MSLGTWGPELELYGSIFRTAFFPHSPPKGVRGSARVTVAEGKSWFLPFISSVTLPKSYNLSDWVKFLMGQMEIVINP